MQTTQEMLRLLTSTIEGTNENNTYLSESELINELAQCLETDNAGNIYIKMKESDNPPYLRVKFSGDSDDRRTTEIYQMTEKQIWNTHNRIWAQNVTVNKQVPDEFMHYSDYLSLPLSENKSGVIYDYLIHYDDDVLYYDPANSGNNVDSEARIFKDLDEFLASDETKGVIYLKVSIFDDPGFLAKWYVTKDHWVVEDPEHYEVLRTYTKMT